MGGIHGQWVAGAGVMDDLRGWGRGDVMQWTSAGGEGRAGREGSSGRLPEMLFYVC
jgi:hypothetical protein